MVRPRSVSQRRTITSPPAAREMTSSRATVRPRAVAMSSTRLGPLRRAVVKHPRLPHRHRSPSSRTLMCASSPATPPAPRYSLPSMTMPAPNPGTTLR
jgi:hypothetical protein